MRTITISELRISINTMYRSASFFQWILCLGRPYICPFHILIKHVPPGASILDIGCGSGLFLNLLIYKNLVTRAIGIDAAQRPIETACRALKLIDTRANATFEHRPVEAGLPNCKLDVVSMIDVLHHIDPEQQHAAIEAAASRVADNGIFLFKDISPRPLWRAWANRVHDLLLVQQWINYVRDNEVEDWMSQVGFRLIHKETINMWWYGHKLMIFRRDSGGKIGGH